MDNNNFDCEKSIDHQRTLDKFLVGNSELEELSARLSIFNIFKVLRIEQAEIRHSNVLAWLLDPRESHGLGEAFIRRFVSTLLLESEGTIVNLTPAAVELMNMIDVEVWREWKNTDLVTFSRLNNWVLIIENKIKSGSSERQLLKYIDTIKKEFPKYTIIPLLLTLDIDDGLEAAEKAGFICWSHAQMYHVVHHVISQRQDRIPEDAKVFLDHYLTILRRLTMQDERLINLCKEIYKKHKDAIDLINELGVTTQFGAAVDDFISDHENIIQLCIRPYRMWFIPKVWGKSMPTNCTTAAHLSLPYPIVCWFSFSPKVSKVGFAIEIGGMNDSGKRLELIKTFDSEGFKVGKKAFRSESKYTRVHSIYISFDDPDDKDEIGKHLNELWQKSKQAMDSATKIIESFKW